MEEKSLHASLSSSLEELIAAKKKKALRLIKKEELKAATEQESEVYSTIRKLDDGDSEIVIKAKEPPLSVGDKVRKLREILNVSQTQLSLILDVGEKKVRQWEQTNKIQGTDKILINLLLNHPELVTEIEH